MGTSDFRLSIGLLTPAAVTSKYVVDLLQWGESQPHFNLFPIPLPAQNFTHKSGSSLRRLLEKIILKLDGKYLNTTWYRDHLHTQESPRVSSQETMDYIVSLSGDAIPADLLAKTTRGGLLLQAGVPTQGHPGPLGFWPVFCKKPTTPFKIILQKKDGGLEEILAGHLLTQSSYLLTQAYVSKKALHYLKVFLSNQALGRTFSWQHLQGDTAPVENRITSWHLLSYILKRVWRTLEEKIQTRRNLDQQWNVAFLDSDWVSRNPSKGTPFPLSARQFFADPFVISRNGIDVCFVEEYDFHTGLGHISAFELRERQAIPLGVVFKEPFHLSFPYLFEYQNELFMCPETSGAGEIRVYKCLEFPLKWKLEKTLMKSIAAVDSMIFEKDNKWWMLTNIDPLQKNDHCTELLLFSADSPLSESWTPHPQNPLVIDPRKARNGGLVRSQDKIFRISQTQKYGVYGAALEVHEIQELSETRYREKTVSSQQPDFFKNIYGSHHLHSNGRWTVYDFCRKVKVDR